MSEQMSAEDLAIEIRQLDQTTVCGEAWQELSMTFDETVALILADRKSMVERCKEAIYKTLGCWRPYGIFVISVDDAIKALNALDAVLEGK